MQLQDGGERHFHGHVIQFTYAGTEGSYACYHARVRPWLSFLTMNTDCRAFQNLSVPDIAEQIFTKYPVAAYSFMLKEQHPVREYCVQYNESDLTFIHRLFEDEGIFYFFEHKSGEHKLIIADSDQAYTQRAGYKDVPFYPRDDQSRRERDHLYDWQSVLDVRPGRFIQTSFDFEKPKAELETRRLAPRPHAQSEGEIYCYPACYTAIDTGNHLAQIRLEESQAAHKRMRGAGTVAGLGCGQTFSLTNYPRKDQNAKYQVLAVEHEIWSDAYRTGSSGGEEEPYLCTIAVQPSAMPFRPPLVTPKPVMAGPESAIVTGPAGEEIWTDKYGRVKVQFPWDRQGKNDENSSCWVRVSQAWAGAGFGSVQIPRIGQEVLVEFLQGDVDRPIITGRVYNGSNMPPYQLPAAGVVSGMKSNTHKGRGYNEIAMDDTTSKEKITIHGQYDMNTTIEHDQTNTVKNDFTETITKNAKVEISEGSYNHDVKTGTATYHVQGALSEKYDSTQDTTVKAAITIKSSGGPISVSADSQHVYIHAATSIELHTGASKLKMDSSGKISLEGTDITINGTTQVTTKGGIVHSQADSQHQTTGAIVLSEGSATNTVKGGMVMLNPSP
jgi:type VI secretion system secreted protein VgrG